MNNYKIKVMNNVDTGNIIDDNYNMSYVIIENMINRSLLTNPEHHENLGKKKEKEKLVIGR